MREPKADAFMLVQDDVILYDREDLRSYLEGLSWPPDLGVVSLFTSRAYSRDTPGWYEFTEKWVWGAQVFIFPLAAARSLVADEQVLAHRWNPRNDGCANIDIVVGEWALRQKMRIFIPTPSLAQHIGHTSTLWKMTRAGGNRWADRFAGDAP
jgi:hypothetical protein